MEAQELGRRLRSVREARGLSQQAAADALDLPKTVITQMEAGNRAVSTLELSRFADLYVHPVAGFLQEGAWNEDELVASRRRLLEKLSMFSDVEDPERRRHRDRELRSEVARLAIEVYRREEISRGRVLELGRTLGTKGDVLLQLAEAARGG